MHVRQAVRELSPYRPGKTAEDVRRYGLSRAVKLGSNENPLGPAPEVLEAIQKGIPEVRLYPEPGAPRLRRALAEHYQRDPEEIVAGAGIDDLLDLTVRAMLEPGDNLVLADPGFVRYRVAADSVGGSAILVPGPAKAPYTHDLDGMLAAINPRTRIVVLVNPNNPTGSMFGRQELESFLEKVPEGVLTILDEAYYEFVEDSRYPNGMDYLGGEKPILVFRTFSKIHALAGLRVGFGVGPTELVGFLDRARLPFNVNVLAQEAAIAALGASDHVVRSRKFARTEVAFLKDSLLARGWTVHPTWTNFVFAESPVPGEALAGGLMKKGFLLRPLTGFGLDERFFRISPGTHPENEEFLQALDTVSGEIG